MTKLPGIAVKHWSREVREQTCKLGFSPSFKATNSSIEQRRLNYTSAEQRGYLVLWYTKENLRDSFNTFQKQDYFILSPQTASKWKIFPSFSISSLLLTPSTLFPFHLLSNLSPLKDIYLYLLWHSTGFPPPFWCNESRFQSVTLGWKISSQSNPI